MNVSKMTVPEPNKRQMKYQRIKLPKLEESAYKNWKKLSKKKPPLDNLSKIKTMETYEKMHITLETNSWITFSFTF